MYDNHKTRMIRLPRGEESMTIGPMLSCFHRIGLPERNGRTDGQTDRQITDGIAISILRVSMLTRDKNLAYA